MLLPFINKPFNGVIWRLEIDELSDTIFLEIRNAEDKIVSFSSVSLSTGKLNFTGFTTPERWLTGMEAAYDGVLLLHHYQTEQSPVHKAVVAVNNEGEVSWSNYTYAFDHLSVNGPVVYNAQIEPKKLFLADIKTGSSLRSYEPSIDADPEFPIQMPQIVPPSYLTITFPAEPYGNNIHYLEYNNFRIVSLHSLNAGQLKQHLYIMDDANVVYEDLLNADIQKMQPESFTLYKNLLIYIKNKSELMVVNL
jgi:hypothetical protein